MNNQIYIFVLFFIVYQSLYSQSITIDTTMSPQVLVNNILLSGNQTVSNIQFTGNPSAIGYFSGGASGVCPPSGIILSTGFVRDAKGPNNPQIEPSGQLQRSGDADLNTIAGAAMTFDATILEFDFLAQNNLLQFQFVFASDEYPEFVGMFNDVFAFFISGKNPDGGFYNKKNIAILPNTTIPITINNVNDTTNNQFFINYIGGSNVAFDGLTVTINISEKLVAGTTYHFKIAIADFGDDVLDSAVFLKAGSFTTFTSISTDNVCLGEITNFSANFGNSVANVLWNFGDGHTSTQLSPSHVYQQAGIYQISVLITYLSGVSETITKQIEIFEKPETPIIGVN